MQVVEIEVGKLHPNPWNVNRMSAAMQKKLAAYIKREGLVEPLVVRLHPKIGGAYELLGGEHRWRLAKEVLNYPTVPCVVVTGLDERRARILSINLNEMSGESVPSLLSKLLSELHQDMPLPDLEATLPYDAKEITDALSLMQLPEGLGDELEDEAARRDQSAPHAMTIVFDREQLAIFEEALAAAKEEIGPVREPRARAVTRMAEAYLAETRRAARAGRVEG